MIALLFYFFITVFETSFGCDHPHLSCENIYSHENWHLLDLKGECGLSPKDENHPEETDNDYGTNLKPRSSFENDDDDVGSYGVAPRIMRGLDAAEHEFPWMAQLMVRNFSDPVCGGALINKRYVLTAAHCFGKAKREINKFKASE